MRALLWGYGGADERAWHAVGAHARRTYWTMAWVRDPLRRFLSAYDELCLKPGPAACAHHPAAPAPGGAAGGRGYAGGLRGFLAYTAARPCWDEHVCDQVPPQATHPTPPGPAPGARGARPGGRGWGGAGPSEEGGACWACLHGRVGRAVRLACGRMLLLPWGKQGESSIPDGPRPQAGERNEGSNDAEEKLRAEGRLRAEAKLRAEGQKEATRPALRHGQDFKIHEDAE